MEIVNVKTGEIEDDLGMKWQPETPPGTALVKVNPGLDESVSKLGTEAMKLVAYANSIEVINLDSERVATDSLVICRDMIKRTEAEQKRWLEPVKDAEAKIKGAFDLILSPLKNANTIFTNKVKVYRNEEKRKADEAAEIARKKAELAAMEAKAKGEEPPPVEPVYLSPAQVKTHRANLGSATMSGSWKFRWKQGLSQNEILERLPLQYHMANETLIGQIVRAKAKNNVTEKDFGDTVEIYFDEGIRVTSRREPNATD